MFEFRSTISGIPCIIRVIHYDKYIPASVSGLPEESYPAEGGTSDWIEDIRGRIHNEPERVFAVIDGDSVGYTGIQEI